MAQTERRTDRQHQASDRRVQVHVLVRVGMVERQAGVGKRRELSTDFRRKLPAHTRTEVILHTKPQLVGRKPA